MNFFLRCCLLVFICVILDGSATYGLEPAAGIKEMKQTADTFAEVIERAKPAVVYLNVEKEKKDRPQVPFSENDPNAPVLREFFGDSIKNHDSSPMLFGDASYGFGSGFIFTSDGYILTNSHVIRDATEVAVTLGDKRKMKARVIGEDRKTDIGLIKIDAVGLPTLPLGDSDKLKAGHWVLAIGSPYEFVQTVTAGIVSATGRSSLGISDYENFIQTDAAINPGNSGGPLLNIHGQVVGINTAFLTRTGGYMGIGFAIPINMARTVSEQLLSDGKVTRAWLGVALKDAEAEHLAEQGLGAATQAARVVSVSEKSPAASAGLREGDVLTAFMGIAITGAADLRNRVALSAPGSQVTLEYFRKGLQATCNVTLGTL
jgi:serine protease Do